MAIFDNRIGGFSSTNVPTPASLEIPSLDLTFFGDMLKQSTDIQQMEIAESEQAIESMGKLEDEILGIKVDNETQRELLDRAYARVGLDPNIFKNMNIEQFKNPLFRRQVQSKISAIGNTPEVREVERERLIGDNYFQQASKIENPGLRAKAMKDYEGYLNGEKSGKDLSIESYLPVDYQKIILDNFKSVDEELSARENVDLSQDGDIVYEELVKRNSDLIDLQVNNMISNERLLNNIMSDFKVDRDGAITYIENIGENFKKERVNDIIWNATNSGGATAKREATRLENLKSYLDQNNWEMPPMAEIQGWLGSYKDLKIGRNPADKNNSQIGLIVGIRPENAASFDFFVPLTKKKAPGGNVGPLTGGIGTLPMPGEEPNQLSQQSNAEPVTSSEAPPNPIIIDPPTSQDTTATTPAPPVTPAPTNDETTSAPIQPRSFPISSREEPIQMYTYNDLPKGQVPETIIPKDRGGKAISFFSNNFLNQKVRANNQNSYTLAVDNENDGFAHAVYASPEEGIQQNMEYLQRIQFGKHDVYNDHFANRGKKIEDATVEDMYTKFSTSSTPEKAQNIINEINRAIRDRVDDDEFISKLYKNRAFLGPGNSMDRNTYKTAIKNGILKADKDTRIAIIPTEALFEGLLKQEAASDIYKLYKENFAGKDLSQPVGTTPAPASSPDYSTWFDEE